MNIDWSKAPEGATHWDTGINNRVAGWMKLDDGIWYWWPVKDAKCDMKWHSSLNQHLIEMKNFIARPCEWNGEGLPPVGIEIEAMLPALGSARFWQIAKVVHGPLPESPGEILVFSLENTKPSWVDQFRPIRTPEQIAAEERESELNRMVATVSMLDKGWARKVCAGLYDAGYRKQASQ